MSGLFFRHLCGVAGLVRRGSLAVLAGLFATSCFAGTPATLDATYLFVYFTGQGKDGLHLAWSGDGYHWHALNGGRACLAPEVGPDRLMRDPCVALGPDGVYHLVWTPGWWDKVIGTASTRDFLTWSTERTIPVMMNEPLARNAWAPEAFWDAKRSRFLIYWSTTIPGRFPATDGSSEHGLNHRIYCTTTEDWTHFTPTRLLSDPGFSIIDATLCEEPQGTFRMIAKDETVHPVAKRLRLATASDPEGPWTTFSAPFTRAWVEGPTAIHGGGDTGVYYDVYREGHYGAVRSADLVHWEDITSAISVPPGARHGTMIQVPRSLVDHLIASLPAPAAK